MAEVRVIFDIEDRDKYIIDRPTIYNTKICSISWRAIDDLYNLIYKDLTSAFFGPVFGEITLSFNSNQDARKVAQKIKRRTSAKSVTLSLDEEKIK